MTPRQQLAQAVRNVILATIDRRPVSECPAEGTVTVVDNGTVARFGNLRTPATFKGGKWVRTNGTALPFEPTVWLAFRNGGK